MAGQNGSEVADVGHLFALATARLEDATSIAVEGQSSNLTATEQSEILNRLSKAVAGCKRSLARIAVVLEPDSDHQNRGARI